MEDIQLWKKAGAAAAEALEYGRKLIKEGAVIREVCDKIDQKILDLGARPAWPTQVGMNEVAAHYTPDHDDDSEFKDQLVSIDVGAHVDGYVGDNACTVDLSGKYSHLAEAAKNALEAASKVIGPGVKLRNIGREIAAAMKTHNAVPVKNLSGHGINRWEIHDYPSIPNFDNNDEDELEAGQIIAIEPFSTDGIGVVDEMEQANLFSLIQAKPVRSQFAREVMRFVEQEYKNLPFCTRWLIKEFGQGKTNLALRELQRVGNVKAYPPLVERTRGKVAQFENTFLVTDNGAELLTKF
ncbi:type II methionyl aminopeptidase [Candidatus Woesearchaeota archaeon]|nr:type II methionyl aminopeptidase [Candidatus Woesearchaeota archaeon]